MTNPVRKKMKRYKEILAKFREQIPKERYSVIPNLERSEKGIYYEDPFCKIHLYDEGEKYFIERTEYRKSEDLVTVETLDDICTKKEACLEFREAIAEHLLHPFKGFGPLAGFIALGKFVAPKIDLMEQMYDSN